MSSAIPKGGERRDIENLDSAQSKERYAACPRLCSCGSLGDSDHPESIENRERYEHNLVEESHLPADRLEFPR